MKKIISLSAILLLVQLAFAQPGAIDLTFNPGDPGFGKGDGPNGYIGIITMQPDGKLLIGGGFLTYNGILRIRIARLNPDGTLDQTFDPGTGNFGTTLDIQVLESGKILVGGLFHQFN
jgi:hypothetical protein